MKLLTLIRQCMQREDGTSAIEFAFVAPVLLLLTFGLIEFAMIMLTTNVMESATQVSARLGKTGYNATGVTRQQTIINSIKSHAGSLVNTNNLTISSKYYKQYDQINDPEPYTDSNHNNHYDLGEVYSDVNGNAKWDADMGLSGYGNTGDIVVYTITYPWHIMTPIMSRLIGSNGTYTIDTHSVVKNEPY